MLDRAAPSATVCLAGVNGPQREGRPCSRNRRRQHQRAHPYLRQARRLAMSSQEPLRAASINGNGQVHTLTKGLDGAERSVPGDSLPEIHNLLQRVAAGEIDPALAATHITSASQQVAEDTAARDVWGEGGIPAEIVWAPGRSATQIAISLQRSAQDCGKAMAARVSEQVAAEVAEILPEAKYHPSAAALVMTSPESGKQRRLPGTVAIVGGGPQEEAATEEAKLACSVLGCYAYRLAGTAAGGSIQNLAAAQSAAVVIVVAREGDALPGIVAGLTNAPVIAVSASGSCELKAPGVSVVGGGNGVAAAVFAARILQLAARIGGAGKA